MPGRPASTRRPGVPAAAGSVAGRGVDSLSASAAVPSVVAAPAASTTAAPTSASPP